MIVNNRIIPGGVGQIGTNYGGQSTSGITKPNSSFEDIFAKKIFENKEVKFSKHAESRLQTRNIQLTEEQKGKLMTLLIKREKRM